VSGGDHGAIRVETGISRRVGGTYSAEVCVDYVKYRRSFETLTGARRWRKRMRSKGGQLEATHRQSVREALAKADRTTVERDGRTFTVIHLPPGGIAA